jgi:hypothetical protein
MRTNARVDARASARRADHARAAGMRARLATHFGQI